ncbi:MAG TPA: ABC transporter substrate-binding protein [Burkholderiales bacterium]
MNRRDTLLALLALGAVGGPLAAEVQQSKTGTVRIGILVGGSRVQRGHLENALLEGLRDQGYVEGRNLVIERRYADGHVDRTPEFAHELAAMQLDSVVTTCTPTTRAAQKALGSTPIVMAAVADPVAQNMIASLARPGANTTGLSSQAEDIMPKMLELFAGILPTPTTIAVLADASSNVHPRMWQVLGVAAKSARNIDLVRIDAGRRNNVSLSAAFDAAAQQRAGGILVLPDEPLFLTRRADIVALAAKHRLPAFYGAREFVDDGGLMSYGENLRTAYRTAAAYIAKVAQGAKPGELPVQQPTNFELIINMKTANALGIAIPQSVLIRANQVIE